MQRSWAPAKAEATGTVESVTGEAASGRCKDKMESRRLGDSNWTAMGVYTEHSRKQAQNGFVKPDPSQRCRMLRGAGGPRGEDFGGFWSFQDSDQASHAPYPACPRMCHGQIMTSGGKYLNTEEVWGLPCRSAFC